MTQYGFVQTSPEGIVVPSTLINTSPITIDTFIEGTKNAKGVFIAQVIGKNKVAIPLRFPILTQADYQTFLRLFNPLYGGSFLRAYTVFDPELGDFRVAMMYPGTRTGQPLELDANFKPQKWADAGATLTEA